jgi:phosphate/sulfate permease
MNVKNFLVSGVVGGIVNFLLGWVFYGMLFKDIYPEGENMNLLFTFLGCLTSGLFIAYIFTKWAGITNSVTGIKAGAVIGFFTSLSMNLFMYSNRTVNYQNMALDVIITIVISAFMGAAIAFVNGKMK